jgi:hypothetical protein
MVHLTIGSGRWDPTCYGKRSLPHFDVGASPQNSERYFSSGNERTFVNLAKAGPGATKYGYHLRASDRFAFIVDLMNMNMEDKTVYMTMTYDILDGPLPAGWRDIKVVWFDANQCGTSEVKPKAQNGKYTISSSPWTPNFSGENMGVGGHLHDGGINLEVNLNGALQCDSTAAYGERPEYVSSSNMKMGPAAGIAEKHISSMRACYFNEIKTRQLSKGQSWQIKANYDYDKYPGNKEGNSQASVMAM